MIVISCRSQQAQVQEQFQKLIFPLKDSFSLLFGILFLYQLVSCKI